MKMIIHTPTLEDYTEVVQWSIDQGNVWVGDGSKSIHRDQWYVYSSGTCITIGYYGGITYCEIGYVINSLEADVFTMEQFHRYNRDYIYNKFAKKYDLR